MQRKTFEAQLVGDLNGGLHNLFIYCDLLEHVNVGDTLAPLLRTVAVSGAVGESVTRVFSPPRYIPMRRTNFESIEIDIKDDLGEPVAFEGGRVVVTVHCRRVNSGYLPA